MKILAIETSCDETAIALLDINGPVESPDIKIVANTLLSQIALHEKYGGVYPNLAKREHIKNLPILLDKVLLEARLNDGVGQARTYNLTPNDIDYIAVTEGPGLEPALWTGITFAEELARKWSKPIIPVNHMEGHIWSILYEAHTNLQLPAVALLVSGGHTELVHIKDFGKYEILGRTRDDAVGEAFDKVARMLGLPYPGGPQISTLAEICRSKNQESIIKFPRPMIHSDNLNFSYSGLKTAVLYKLKELGEIDSDTKAEVARAFEDAAIDVLLSKTRTALKTHEVQTLIIAGGVSGNKHLRNEFENLIKDFPSIELKIPSPLLTTDNAIMIGIAAYVMTTQGRGIGDNKPIQARGNLELSSWAT